MIDLSDFTAALQASITTAQTDVDVLRSDWLNENPNLAPWICIYKSSVRYAPESLGRGPHRWDASIVAEIAIQEYSSESGADCEDLLEARVKSVLDQMDTDYTVGGQVEMLTEIEVGYSMKEDVEEDMFFQMAHIRATWRVGTQ